MQDGNSNIPIGNRLNNMPSFKTALEVLGTLRSKTTHFNNRLKEVEATVNKLKSPKELHRPDQGQMLTSGPQIDPEILQECVLCVLKVFKLAQNSVPKR